MRYLYSLQSFAQSLSWQVRYLIYIGMAVVGCAAVISMYPRIWWIVLLGVAVIALLLLLFKLMLTLRDRKRGKETNAKVLSGSQGRGGVTDAQSQAALDDLQKKFSSGVETLDSLGLDLYALPWFVIVGQPASGKTEAIRRCRIPFPPGLTDELQGTGGTVNMDWWFTNDAVILDTAGKMLFQEAGQGTSQEWVKFLKLVREARPHCPINGMLLVIPADSLISDSPEQIDQNAKTIATQLNLIQRTLGVRFPVFVLITKCDLVTGFREFFDSLDDRRHQQMLGWSNPDPLDTTFDPSKIEAHLALVRQRLEQRRFELLQDPVSANGKSERRLDEVDRLFDFPAAMEDLSDKLQSYLEIIFTGSKLAPKPLFLRGIYFTSSIQKGSILDGVLAEAMDVPLDSLTETRPFERVRPLFLRDLFMEKIFPEGGLVTRADNTVKLKARRRSLVLGTAAIGTIVLISMSWFGFRTFQKSIGNQGDVWTGIADTIRSDDPPSLLMETSPGMTSYFYDGDRNLIEHGDNHTTDELPGVTHALAIQHIKVPFIFRLTSGFGGDLLRNERHHAHRTLLGAWIMRPVVAATVARLDKTTSYNDPKAIAALAQLIRLHTLRTGEIPSGRPATDPADTDTPRDSPANLIALLHFNISGENSESLARRETQIQQLQQLINETLIEPEDRQAFARQALEGQVTDGQIKGFLDKYLESLDTQTTSHAGPVAQLNQLVASLQALDTAQVQLHRIETAFEPNQSEEILEHWETWSRGDQGFVPHAETVLRLVAALEDEGYKLSKGLETLFQEAAEKEMTIIRNQLPSIEGDADTAPTEQDTETKDLYTSIGNWINDCKPELGTQSQSGFAAVKNKFLAFPPNHDSPAAEHPCDLLRMMYEATAEFHITAPDQLTLSGLAAAIDTVETEQNNVAQALAVHIQHLEDFDDVQAYCEFILDLQSKKACSERLTLVIGQNINPTSIGQDIQRFATPEEDEEAWLKPRIPMSVGFDRVADENGYYESLYHPEGLEIYLGGLERILKRVQPPNSDSPFADPAQDHPALEHVREQLEDYLLEYARYWTETVVQDASYKQAEDWETFTRAARGVRAQTVQRGLDLVADQIKQAFAVIPSEILGERHGELKEHADQVDKALTALSADRDNIIEQANELIRHWQRVDNLQDEARNIRTTDVHVFERTYLKEGLYPTDHAAAPVAFWQAFTEDPLRLVANEGADEIDDAREKLADPQQFMRFPLFNRPERGLGDVLTSADLDNALAAINLLLVSTTSTRNQANSIGTGQPLEGYNKINALLHRLRGEGRGSAQESQRLERLAQIGAALSGDGTQVEVWIPGEEFLNNHIPSGKEDMVPANRRFTHVDLPGNQETLSTQTNRNQKAFTLTIPGNDNLELNFCYEAGIEVAANRVPYMLGGRWSAINAILPTGSEDDVVVDDDNIYWVPIEIQDHNTNQTRRYYWIGLKFEHPLPSPTNWPAGEAP